MTECLLDPQRLAACPGVSTPLSKSPSSARTQSRPTTTRLDGDRMSLGATVALTCAFTWSLSVVLFKKTGDTLHPILLNLLKNGLAFLLMIPTVYFVEGSFSLDVEASDVAILFASGLLGIGIADALVLKSLKMVGATRIAIVECVYSPAVIALSLAFLGETLTWARVVGALLVLSAILCVSVKRTVASAEEDLPTANIPVGMVVGVLGILAMAAGVVLIKPIFDRVPLFWIITLRLGAGSLASVALFQIMCDRPREIAALRAAPRKDLIFAACLLSTYVSMIMWVAGFKYNDAMIAAVLNQTSTIFTVALATIFLHERFTPMKAVGTALAVGGVLLMALS